MNSMTKSDTQEEEANHRGSSTSTVPTDTSILFAVSGALAARADKDNFDSIMRFVRRMPAEYQVITVRDSIAKQQDLVTLDCFTKWTTDNAAVLL